MTCCSLLRAAWPCLPNKVVRCCSVIYAPGWKLWWTQNQDRIGWDVLGKPLCSLFSSSSFCWMIWSTSTLIANFFIPASRSYCSGIMEKTGQEDVENIIRKRRLRWLGHVWHMDKDRRANLILHSEGKREEENRGKPGRIPLGTTWEAWKYHGDGWRAGDGQRWVEKMHCPMCKHAQDELRSKVKFPHFGITIPQQSSIGFSRVLTCISSEVLWLSGGVRCRSSLVRIPL